MSAGLSASTLATWAASCPDIGGKATSSPWRCSRTASSS